MSMPSTDARPAPTAPDPALAADCALERSLLQRVLSAKREAEQRRERSVGSLGR